MNHLYPNFTMRRYLVQHRFYQAFSMLLVFILGSAFAGEGERRNLQTFLPRPGETIDAPQGQLVQVLLDRKIQGPVESYMVQILFHGSPVEHTVRKLKDRIIVDFLDCGKPSMRLAKIRGGIISASALEELFYKQVGSKKAKEVLEGSNKKPQIKRMVRLTLFVDKKIGDIKIWDTLDRTLMHFRFPEPSNP